MDTISQSPLFLGIETEYFDALLLRCAFPAPYAAGMPLIDSTARAAHLGFVLSGSALVYKMGDDSRRILMSRLVKGDAFGMATLFGDVQMPPTEIFAESTCHVMLLPKHVLEESFRQVPRLASNYIALLSGRIHFLTQRLDALTQASPRLRLLSVLSDLHRKQQCNSILLPFSLSQMAELLGTSRASLYRALEELVAEGVLSHQGRRITVLRSDMLSTP